MPAMGLVFNTRLSALMARALAPTGALFTVIALWTGAVWGKPTWGTWWVWDARLTSELILLFLYLGYLGLVSAIDDPRRADRGGAILLLAGVVNVPDHLLLGAVVEHPAPGRIDQLHGGAVDGAHHAGRHAADGGRLLGLFGGGGAGAGALPDRGARQPWRGGDERQRRHACSSSRPTACALVLLAAEVWTLVRRSRAQAAALSKGPRDEA